MYHKGYGIVEALAPLHVGASAGEETGNLNLIFRDQFTQTGIVPGSSIRGRFRADMRQNKGDFEFWYGADAKKNDPDSTSEGIAKFEYASVLWIPVYCPNQPVVRVSCPALLKRYQRLLGQEIPECKFTPYSYFGKTGGTKKLFFNLGFVNLGEQDNSLKAFMPQEVTEADAYLLVVVSDQDMAMIHDMALYRQSRVSLDPDIKIAKRGAFFNLEALPEGTVMVFPMALRQEFREEVITQAAFLQDSKLQAARELYFGGLESIGFGRTNVTLKFP
jgi:CRISPR-associated protein Cmr4